MSPCPVAEEESDGAILLGHPLGCAFLDAEWADIEDVVRALERIQLSRTSLQQFVSL